MELLRRPEAALFALVLGAYAYFYQAGGWNQNSRFDLTRAWVEHGTAAIDSTHGNTGDKARRDGHYYCDKAPGASLLAAPAWAALHLAAGRPEKPSPRLLAAGAWLATVTAVGLPSAVSVVALALLLAALGVAQRPRFAIAAAYGLATLAWPYATLFYGHQLTAALSLIAFAILIRARQLGDGRGARPAALVGAGVLLGVAVAVEYPSALLGMVAAGYAAIWLRPLRQLGWLAAGAALPGVLVALYHLIVFGGPATLPYEFSTQPHRSMGFFMGLGRPDPEAMIEILFGAYRGLFFSAPWLLLALPGALRLVRVAGGRYRGEAIAALAAIVLYVWLNASLVDWQGGWAMGARYLVPAIPFLAILVAGLVVQPSSSTPARRPARLARVAWLGAGLLVAGSFALMLIGTAVKPEVPVHIRRPFGAYLVPAFRAGRLAINTQSIDHPAGPPRGPRQATNLGMLAGLDGPLSLLPLGVFSIACAVWLRRSTRRLARDEDAATPAARPAPA